MGWLGGSRQRAEGGGQRAEVRSQKTEDGRQKADIFCLGDCLII